MYIKPFTHVSKEMLYGKVLLIVHILYESVWGEWINV